MVLHCVRLGLGVTIVPRGVSRLSMTGITIGEIDEPCVQRRVLTALHRNESRQVPLTRRPTEIAYPFCFCLMRNESGRGNRRTSATVSRFVALIASDLR